MTVQGKVEIWLHIHGFNNGLFEVSASGTDSGRVEIPAVMVDRFHTDPSRQGKALFRVPEYLVVGLGVYQPRSFTATVRTASADENHQSVKKTEMKPVPILDEGRLHREIAQDVYEFHAGNAPVPPGYLESGRVIRSPGAEMKRDLSGAISIT